MADLKFALDGVAKNVATPEPRPDTPVEIGKPVQLESVPDEGVPRAPPFVTNAPALPTFTPKAVITFVPVVIVEGAAPAPPPTTRAFAAKAAEVAHVEAEEKYGIPPDVPATVNAGVVVPVATEIIPPVNPTEVTVPFPVPAPISVLKSAALLAVTVLSAFTRKNVIAPGFVKVNKLEPTVVAPISVLKFAAVCAVTVLSAFILRNLIALGLVRVKRLEPTVVAPKFVLAFGAVVAPVPPLPIATVPVTFAAVPVVF